MQVGNQLGQIAVTFNDRIRKFPWMTGRKTKTFNPGNFMHNSQQSSKITYLAIIHQSAISINVLPQEIDFLYTLLCQTGNFRQYIIQGAGKFLTSSIRYYTKRTIFRTTFHNRNESRPTIDSRRWQMIKFFNFGKRNINLRKACFLLIINQARQSVKCLRAKHYIYKRCAFYDCFTFLGSYTARDTDNQIWFFIF